MYDGALGRHHAVCSRAQSLWKRLRPASSRRRGDGCHLPTRKHSLYGEKTLTTSVPSEGNQVDETRETAEAENAVAVTKFPPQGTRSLTAALPHFHFERVGAKDVISQLNSVGSTVFVMIETPEAVDNARQIAAVDGVDVLLLGANDLSLSLGIFAEWEHPMFQAAARNIADACREAGKVFGVSGIYTRPDVVKHMVKELGARYILGFSDMGLVSMAMKKNVEMLKDLQ